VLSTYRVRMSGPKEQFPVLLCNGNSRPKAAGPTGRTGPSGTIPGPSRATCSRSSPAILVANRDAFTTACGREVDLGDLGPRP
jgi:aminopeptidase N